MQTLEFLKKVLPISGHYVNTIINIDGRKQGFFDNIEDLAKSCTRLDRTNNNTYFAISAFVEKGNRKQENVRATKVIAIDIDCGSDKPYPTWKEGLIELGKFIKKMDLPKPMVVFSGNGLHVYWVLNRELAPTEWKPLANSMKMCAIDNKFDIDAGLTANSALVLRPVGTHNPKNNKEVMLLIDADPISPDVLKNKLSDYVSHQAVQQERGNMLLKNLATKQEFPPAISTIVENKCLQINWAINNQDKVPEPLWYDLIGIASFCINPEETAKRWSSGHPKYNEKATLSKLQHWQKSASGPTTCNKFAVDRPNGCRGCKFKDKIGSPARLGIQHKEVQTVQAPDTIANQIAIPRPFKRTTDGIKISIDDTDIDICKFDIYPVGYGKDESLGYETVRYHWKRPHVGWQELTLRQAYLTEGHREFATAIADQGIVLHNRKQTEYFQLMLRTYMDELRSIRSMTNLYATMGWKENKTQFVIGDTIISRKNDGTVTEESITLASSSHRLGQDLYGMAGDIAEWTKATTLLDKVDMPWYNFSLGVGLSAPLYAFTGLKGLTVSLYGPTGGGKTLAQYWVQSLYGDPEKLHFAAKFTQNTLFGRLGLYSNLPMTIDEVTLMQDKEVGDFCYWVSQGRDKARMNRNAEERDAKTWATPVLVSTNKSLQSKLIASGLETDAQMARLLEVPVPSHDLFTKDSSAGRKLYNFITTNYGHIGKEYIKRLLEIGPEDLSTIINDATENFSRTYKAKFSGEERYWETAITLADLGSRLANEWGLIQYDYKKGTEWILSQIGAIRRTVKENQVDSFDLIAEYLNDCASTAVTVMHTVGQKATVDHTRLPRGEIRVRFDVFRKDSSAPFDKGTIMIDRTHFRKWLSMRGADYKSFTQELLGENVLATPKSQKFYLGKDTPIKLGQSYVIGVNLNHPRLQGILDDADTAAEDLVYGNLGLI